MTCCYLTAALLLLPYCCLTAAALLLLPSCCTQLLHAMFRHIEVWLNVMDVVMDGATPRVEGARTDEQVLGDNPLVPVQHAHTPAVQQAANLESLPPVCQDTVEQQEAAVMASRLDYTDAEVMVEVVAAADFKPNMLNLTGLCCWPSMCIFACVLQWCLGQGYAVQTVCWFGRWVSVLLVWF